MEDGARGRLKIRLFGSFSAERDGEPLSGLRLREGKRLLAYLVLHAGQEVPYQTLAEKFWPGEARSIIGGNDLSSTRQALRSLRTALGEDAYRLQSVGRGLLRFDISNIDVDVYQFDGLAASDKPADWQEAVRLCEAPLLENWADPWVAVPRKRRREQYERLVRLLEPAPAEQIQRTPPHHNLPYQLSSFVGREPEIAAVLALLSTTRLLTLTGPAGGGKTRLALQIAQTTLANYPDGAWFVDLSSTSRSSVVQTIAQTMGINERQGEPIIQTVGHSLKHQSLLLILDNCEHVVEESAACCLALCQTCLSVTILATSREAMRVEGECAYLLPPLTTPELYYSETARSLERYEAVRLFVERARLYRQSFTVTEENATAVAELCNRLDGMPLAIELAAARIRSLTVEEINARLGDRFRLLTGGDLTRPARHQTLRALIDWSHNLLSEPEARLFRRLAVFTGGCTLQTAELVIAGNGCAISDILDLMESLVDKSLVYTETWFGVTRYRMLETLRQYAEEKLQESGERGYCQERHRDFFLQLAIRDENDVDATEQILWKQRLEAERGNFQAALALCRVRPSQMHVAGEDLLARMVSKLWERSFWSESKTRIGSLLSHQERGERRGRDIAVEATIWLKRLQEDGNLSSHHHFTVKPDLPDADGYFGGRLWRTLESMRNSVRAFGENALLEIGEAAWKKDRFTTARLYFEEVLAIKRATNKGGIELTTVLWLAWYLAYQEGNPDAVRLLREEALALHDVLDREQQAISFYTLARIAFSYADRPMARFLLNESLQLSQHLGDYAMEADTRRLLEQISREEGEISE